MGSAVARSLRDSPWRVALLASSSWSHAFLCDKTYRLAPDVASDRLLYQAMQDGDFEYWRNYKLSQLEESGQQEMLNWYPLLGAMQETGANLEYSNFVETGILNSSKVAAVYSPA
jgi:hypothetical protein